VVGSDFGSISAATLIIDTDPSAGPGIFSDGFEVMTWPAADVSTDVRFAKRAGAVEGVGALPDRCRTKPYADFDGDGRSDYSWIRANGADAEWRIRLNTGDGTAAVSEQMFTLGTSADLFDSFDYDGDWIADPVAWNPAAARFTIRPSSRTDGSTVAVIFGATGDVPLFSARYSNDSRDDLAVLRPPAVSGGALVFMARRTPDGAFAEVPIGTTDGLFAFAIAGEFTGDGLADIAVQREDSMSPSLGRFTIYNVSFATGLPSFLFGNSTDLLVPGNHSGNALSDITVSRSPGGMRNFMTRDGMSGLAQPTVVFGVSTDFILSGDFDGDGLTDVAVWRPSATPGASAFRIRPSTATATEWIVNLGQQGDYPIGNGRVQ
jgi:hypothetical protein